MLSPEEIEVLVALKKFMAAMRDWECDYNKAQRDFIETSSDSSACDAQYEIELRKILEETSLDQGRNWARLVDLGCGSPPTYDPDRDIIDSPITSGGSCSIVVHQTVRLKAVYRFNMKLIDGRWMIVKKETMQAEKWKSTAL